ncbi:MAG: DUF6326 family protein [Pseudomonadota bacterium]
MINLDKTALPTPVHLALLWAALMGLYIYNDYYMLYMPGTLDNMASGTMGPLGPATDGVMVGVALLLAIPALMIYLSVGLPAVVSKWLNVFFGAAYTAVEVMTFMGSHLFYQMVVVFEIIVTLLIVLKALRWPKADAA